MKLIISLLFFVISVSVFGQDKVKFTAAGVTCSMCSSAIHKNLTKNSKIKSVNPNLQTQEWNLTYDVDSFDLDLLKKQVQDAGFSIDKVWLNDKLIYEKKKKEKNGNQKERI
jgi:cation transport ATPase